MQQEPIGNVPSQPASTPAPATQVSTVESSNTQSHSPVSYSEDQQAHFNNLISAKRKEGYEKGYEAATREAQQRYSQASAPMQPQPYPPTSMPVPPSQPSAPDPRSMQQFQQIIEATAEKKFKESFAQLHQAVEAKKIADEDKQLTEDLLPKLEASKKKFSDFAEKVDLAAFEGREWFKALNRVPNSGDVMYDLVGNPSRLTAIEQLLNSGNAAKIKMGYQQIQLLATGLQNNDASASKKIPNEPLSEIRPSKVSGSGEVNLIKAAREKYAHRI